jgi:S1-C subfamily serine protease
MKRFNMSNTLSVWVLIILIFSGCGTEQQPRQTISDFSKAIDLKPTDAVAYYNRGKAFAQKEQYENAISDYNRAIEINPSFAEAYINRGLAWGISGYHDRAIADHSKAREITKQEIPSKISLTEGYINIAVTKVRSAVVNISTLKVVEGGAGFLERFFQDQIPRDFEQKSLGSGFIIDEDGFILTYNREVDKTDEIKVTLADKRQFDAMVIGRDPETGLALIKIRAEPSLPVARLGDSSRLKVGQWVLAIGNPFGLGITASIGIIDNNYSDSAFSYLIRTTSSIHLGNKGGALINLKGEVVGINAFGPSQDFLPGNAIPINMAKALVVELKKNGRVPDTKLAQIKTRTMLSTQQFAKESYGNTSIVDKTQLENWINQEFILSRIKSVVLIARNNGKPLGSGFIIDKDGFILTNEHIVEKVDRIKVKLVDEMEFNAKIISRDPKADLALIRIKSNLPLEALPLGDSDKLEIGCWVVPIGHPFGPNIPVTAGIVSAKYRLIGGDAYDNFIQTDAPIRPRNGGGPLLNTAGEVVGVNTAFWSSKDGRVVMGFAIPINMVKGLLPQLREAKNRLIRFNR